MDDSAYCSLDQLSTEGIYPHLKKSELYKSYREFNRNYTPDKNLFSSLSLNTSEDVYIRKVYKRLWINLYRLSQNAKDFHYITKENGKLCTYLKYWFYDKLLHKRTSDTEINVFFNVFEKLTVHLFPRNDCPCEFYRMSIKEIKEIKKLYDYFVFYDGFNYENIINNDTHNSVHCDYLKEAIEEYGKKKEECASLNSKGYCKEFKKNIETYINRDKLTSFKEKCKVEKRIASSEKTVDTEVTLNTDLMKIAEMFISVCNLWDIFINFFCIFMGDFLNVVPLNEFYNALNLWYDNYISGSCICKIFIRDDIPDSHKVRIFCNNLKEMLDRWDHLSDIFKINYGKNNYCDYFNYWIHYRIIKDSFSSKGVQYLYDAWDAINRNKKTKNNYCSKKISNIDQESFKKKKQLYEFLEYFNTIKDKMYNTNTSHQSEYCNFIKAHFELYLDMERNNISQVYNEEIKNFQRKINCELSFLKKKCPEMCLDLVFQANSGSLCSTKHHREVQQKEHIEELLPKISEVYNILNNEENIDNYCSNCNYILSLEKHYPGINKLCKKMARNLRELSKMSNSDSKNRCEYISHWIYDEIKKKFSNNFNYIGDIGFVNILIDIVFHINDKLKKNYCRIDYDRNDSFEELKEMKDLREFFKNNDSIKDKISSVNDKKREFCDYVTYIYGIYKKNIKKCCAYYYEGEYYMENCENYFKCDQIFDPNKLLISLNCNTKVPIDDSKKVYEGATIDYIAKYITKKSSEQAKSLSKVEKDALNMTRHDESGLISDPLNKPGKEENGLLRDPFYIAVFSIFSILGILFLFFCLYKFTPFGSYMNNKSSRERRNEADFYDEYTLELSRQNSKYSSMNSKNRRYQLAYHTE
ncbi:PIR Superfamily Protein [Plasmodium ovale curtisi]|uniref:PIR Superfamily Protein n=1 Tax=Plasmodium ovale curtisi TaxID=864141 RepID=A0A1A8X1I7_PLAOA|nr:PIR Superfamily Protein [Plasmodium ovale curtisi]